MAWLRFSDRYNRRPEIHALDDQTYRALHCLIEAAENFDACGMAIDSYAVGFYPQARQKLRNKIGKLSDRGLVHLLQSPEDRDHDCPTCQTRWEELSGEGGEELRKKWGTSFPTSSGFSKTEPMWFCIRHFYDAALTPTQKRNTKQGDAKRQRDKRQRDKAAESRRDELTPSHPPVPVPVPKLKINAHPIASEEVEPPSTASASEPSDLVQWLREKLAEGRKHVGCKQPKETNEHREKLQEVAEKATRAPGSTVAILTGAVDGFLADLSQREYRYSPHGLAHGFDTYAADVLEQEKAEASARKRVEQDKKLAAIDKRILEKEEREKAEKRRQREANGAAVPANNLGINPEDWS
jgi:hypothetical protein